MVIGLGSCRNAKNNPYVITDFGAVADSSVINTESIQKAIDKCAEDGGGTVVVPEGTFLTGAIFLKQGVNLEIVAGGVLKGTTNMSDYKLVRTRWEGEERIWISALVNVFDINGFRLSGEGMIDGSGDVWFSRRRMRNRADTSVPQEDKNPTLFQVGPVREGSPSLGMEGGLIPDEDSQAYTFREVTLPSYARPRLIAIQNCSNVTVEYLHLTNQSSWGLFVLYSNLVEIRNLVIRAEHYIPSSDGIDIDSSDGVHVSHVDIDVNDDCISIKSGKDEDGRRVNRPAENILIEHSLFRYGHGGVAMGSEMSGGIRNVIIANCVMEADNWAPIRFKSQPSRGGVVENITYRDLVLNGTRQAFEFNMEWRMVPPVKPASNPLPVVRNVRIINVSGTVADAGFIHGLPDSPIDNVTFKNCNIKAERGLRVENVKNLDLSGLTIETSNGEPVIGHNISE
jgi:polygalacturonase